jgi:hypothetical protein
MAFGVLYGLDVGTENEILHFIEQNRIYHSSGEDLGQFSTRRAFQGFPNGAIMIN